MRFLRLGRRASEALSRHGQQAGHSVGGPFAGAPAQSQHPPHEPDREWRQIPRAVHSHPEEGFDVTIRITNQLPDSSLVARRIAPCRLVVCGTPEYFARHGEPRKPDDLRQHNCLGYTFSVNESAWEFVCSRGDKHTVRVDGRVSTNSGDLLRAVTLAGSGIMLMPTFIIGPDLEASRLKAVLTEYQPLKDRKINSATKLERLAGAPQSGA